MGYLHTGHGHQYCPPSSSTYFWCAANGLYSPAGRAPALTRSSSSTSSRPAGFSMMNRRELTYTSWSPDSTSVRNTSRLTRSARIFVQRGSHSSVRSLSRLSEQAYSAARSYASSVSRPWLSRTLMSVKSASCSGNDSPLSGWRSASINAMGPAGASPGPCASTITPTIRQISFMAS
jgi:hypothetical protein